MSVMTDGWNTEDSSVSRQTLSTTGLCEGTRVMTLGGNLPVEYLCKGDMIVTRAGARELRKITARPLAGSPVHVPRSALGPRRPERDMYLAPGQAVHVRDWTGKRLFGTDQRSVPLGQLVDDRTFCWSDLASGLLVYNLEFLTQQVFYAEGMEVMSADQPFRVIQGMAAA